VETEQLVTLDSGRVVASYVQVRGVSAAPGEGGIVHSAAGRGVKDQHDVCGGGGGFQMNKMRQGPA